MKDCIVILLCLLPIRAFFQNDSALVLQMHLHPAQAQVWVDGQKSMSNQFVVLPKGEHKITFWSEGYHQYDTTVVVETSGVKKLIKRLEVKEEYRSYLKKKKQFGNQKLTCKFVQVGLIAGTVGTTSYFYSNAKKNIKQGNEAIEKYNKEIYYNKMSDHRYQYEKEKQALEKNTQLMYISAGVGTLVSGAFWIWRTRNYADSKRPTYQDTEKVKFNVGLGLNENSNYIRPMFNLTVKL